MDGASYIRGLSDTELQRLVALDYDRYTKQELDVARDEQRRRATAAIASAPKEDPAVISAPKEEPPAGPEPSIERVPEPVTPQVEPAVGHESSVRKEPEPITEKEPAYVEERRPPEDPPFWEQTENKTPLDYQDRSYMETPPPDSDGYESSDGDEVEFTSNKKIAKTVIAIVIGVVVFILKFCTRQ